MGIAIDEFYLYILSYADGQIVCAGRVQYRVYAELIKQTLS